MVTAEPGAEGKVRITVHVIMFSNSFPPEVGGIQTHVYNLSRTLVEQGHQVEIVTIRRAETQALRSQLDGLRVFRIPVRRIPKTQTTQYLVGAAALILDLHHKRPVDALHFHTFWPDVFTAFVLRPFMPTVYTVHESYFLILAEQDKFKRRLRLALTPFDGTIAPSTELLQVARKFGVSPVNSLFIPNGVDACSFSSEERKGWLRGQFGIGNDDILVLCPRRLVAKNGVRYFIEGFAMVAKEHGSISAVIAGDGPERRNLEDLVRSMNLESRVRFAGSIDNTQMPSVYADADIVVIPSLMEATSIAGLEAMAAGRPVVATSVGGLPEIVQDGVTGILVPSQDPAGLAGAISTLIRSPDLRSKMGRAARTRVERDFTWNRVAQKTVDVYLRAGRRSRFDNRKKPDYTP